MKEYNSPYRELKRKVNTWCKYTKRIDTYGCGCEHDCKYCYAKSILFWRGFWKDKPMKANIYNIVTSIRGLKPGDIVRLGSMTDCFQPIEKEEKLTYKTILWLNRFRIHYLIVTKSDLVTAPEYLKIYDKELAHFQITITSTDNKISTDYENGTLPENRIKAVELLYKLGFDVCVRLSPFIEQFIDFKILNNIKCNKILIEFLKVNRYIKKWFKIDYTDYTLKYGNYSHLELDKKIELVNKITGFKQISVGEYVFDHYKYFVENVNYNKSDCCNLNYKPETNNLIQTNLFDFIGNIEKT